MNIRRLWCWVESFIAVRQVWYGEIRPRSLLFSISWRRTTGPVLGWYFAVLNDWAGVGFGVDGFTAWAGEGRWVYWRQHTEGSRDAADPAGSSHRARSASEAEPALRCEASARGVRRLITICEPASGLP